MKPGNFPEIPKLLSLDGAIARRLEFAKAGQKLALTNGCFDLMHCGHLHFLNEAAQQADALWVALNADESVKALKGPSRPIHSQWERAYALSSLEAVDGVILFSNKRLDAEISAIKPDVYVKAGDYDIESINKAERAALEKAEIEIKFLSFLPGFSTTSLIEKLRS